MKLKLLLVIGTLTFSSVATWAQSGYVGIGTTSPHSVLDLGTTYGDTVGDPRGKKLAIYNNAAGTDFYGIGMAAAGLEFHAGPTFLPQPVMRVTQYGDFTITGATATKAAGGSGTSWAVTSDARSKTNIVPFNVGLKEILKIQPKTFQYNGRFGTPTNGEVVTGIIAQELQQILPNSIQTVKDKNGESFLQLKTTDQILFGLVNAVKELQKEIDGLKTENTGLKAEVNQNKTMQTQIQQLQSAVQKLQAATPATLVAEAKQ